MLKRFVRRAALARAALPLVVALLLTSPLAFAAGWDDSLGPAPRHRALGGAATGGVADASAVFYNPAGLGAVEKPEFLGAFSLSLSSYAGPLVPAGAPARSELGLTPLPLLCAAVPLLDWLVVGGGVLPAAFQGAGYRFDQTGVLTVDAQAARLVEITPQLAVTVPEEILEGRLAFGAGYRLTLGTLDRVSGAAAAPDEVDAHLFGFDATGLRVGVMYSPLAELRVGASFSTPVVLRAAATSALLSGEPVTDVRALLTLPLRLGLGVRFELDRYALTVDYGFANQAASRLDYVGTGAVGLVRAVQISDWQDSHAIKAGFEYRAPFKRTEIPLRLGYALESAASTAAAPSLLMSPPGPLHHVTLGAGLRTRRAQFNVSLGYAHADATVAAASLAGDCDLCSAGGAYHLDDFSLGVDASLLLER